MDISLTPSQGKDKLIPVVTTFKFGTNPATANTTVTVAIPTPPGQCYPVRAFIHCVTVASDADGTLTLQLIKRRASDDADVALTTAYNIEGLTTKERTELVFTTSVSASDRTFAAADTLEVDLVSNSAAIDTQPTELCLSVEWAVLA